MAFQTRRKFLQRMTAASGALALSPIVTLSAEETPTADGVTDMAIARWETEPDSEAELKRLAIRLTEQALETLGGMGRFVGRGDVVWIKPNIGWNRAPELAANTNPDVVGTLVRLCLEAGAKKVKVGDNSCHNPQQSYRRSGIEAAAKAAGAQVVQLDENRYRKVHLGGKRLLEWPLYPEAIEADLLISVPIVKHHALSQATLCMKNYMGIIGGQRSAWHQDLPTCLCDITSFLKPRLSVLDAIRTLTAHGPQGGNPDDVLLRGTVAAGTDIVALDAFGAELLGHQPEQLASIKAAHERGLGTMDYRGLSLAEVTVS